MIIEGTGISPSYHTAGDHAVMFNRCLSDRLFNFIMYGDLFI